MAANPEHGSQEHNKPKSNEVEGERVVFHGEGQPFQPNPAEQQAAERLGKPPPSELPESLDLPQPQDAAELDRKEGTGHTTGNGSSDGINSTLKRVVSAPVRHLVSTISRIGNECSSERQKNLPECAGSISVNTI